MSSADNMRRLLDGGGIVSGVAAPAPSDTPPAGVKPAGRSSGLADNMRRLLRSRAAA